MHGPNAPWCVGSVFFPPHLLTCPELGPLNFNPLGNPQRLLSTGQKLQQFETAISTSKETESFIRGSVTPFIPSDLLRDHFLSDFPSDQISHFYGNLLQGLKCSDGSVVVFFICGECNNRIGGTVCHRGSGGKWCFIRTSLNSQSLPDSERTDWPVSPPLQYSIGQLSAVWADLSGRGRGTRPAIVAARTNYHVYFCTVSIVEDQVHFLSTAVSKFKVPTAHVTWSPCFEGRAAVMLESGTVCFFEIRASVNSDPVGVVDLAPVATLTCPVQRFFADPSREYTPRHRNQDQKHGRNDPELGDDLQGVAKGAAEDVPELVKKWWRCEFGWLPHTMLIADEQHIFVVDLKEQNCFDFREDARRKTELNAKVSTSGIDLMADLGGPQYSRFCSFPPSKENFVAFCQGSDDWAYEFSAATERHVILFDTRQPHTPILQWEHGMQQDPPSLLIMCPLSHLRSINDKDKLNDVETGRVILAASFKSGDIRVFCYGSKVPPLELPEGNNSKRQKVEDRDWGDVMYAWNLPSRLYAPLADVEDWRDVLRLSQSVDGQRLAELKSRGGPQNIAGILLLSESPPDPALPNEGKKIFTILQLTGQGELLAQTYKASLKLQDPPKASVSKVDKKSDIHTGSVLNPHSSRSSQEGQTKDAGDGQRKLNPDQGQTSGGDVCDGTSQDPPVLNPNLEGTVSKAGLEEQIMLLARALDLPLSMYEVARKVLGMGLPERLSHLYAGLPSDIHAHWHRGYNFPSVSSLLGPSGPDPTDGDSRGASEPPEAARTASFRDTIPLPLLLEVHNIDKRNNNNAVPSSENGDKSQTRPLQSNYIDQTDPLSGTEHCSASEYRKNSGVTFVDGHKLLLDGSRDVETLIEHLVSKSEPSVVSLGESSQEWQENPDDNGLTGAQIRLFSMPDRGDVGRRDSEPDGSRGAPDKAAEGTDAAKSTEGVVLHDAKEKSATTSLEGLYTKFVAGKSGCESQERRPAVPYLKMDPNLCPIKLSFTCPDEELEAGELTALEDMQASFLQWQQSFPPFRALQ